MSDSDNAVKEMPAEAVVKPVVEVAGETKAGATRSSLGQYAGVMGVFAGVIVMGVLVLSLLGKGNGDTPPTFAAKKESKYAPIKSMVYMDYGAVVSAATTQFLEDSKAGKIDAASSGKEFSTRMAAVMNEYKDDGMVVVDKRYIIAAPDGHDITDDVMAKLKLKQN